MSANPSSFSTQSRSPTPDECSVFVQVWVDVNAIQQNSTQGCYAVSNLSGQSTGEGGPGLTVAVPSGSRVCWSVVPIDPQYNYSVANPYLTIAQVEVASGWNVPPTATADPSVFTGTLSQATVSGNVNSNIVLNFNDVGLSTTVTLPVVLTVQPI